MTSPTPSEERDLVDRLIIKASMMELGEKIAWRSDSDLMREAAAEITRLHDDVDFFKREALLQVERVKERDLHINDLLEANNRYLERARSAEAEITRLRAEVAQLDEAARVFEDHYERRVCHHETTHRGGSIWTICDDCGAQWADDEGGFQAFEYPTEIVAARAARRLIK